MRSSFLSARRRKRTSKKGSKGSKGGVGSGNDENNQLDDGATSSRSSGWFCFSFIVQAQMSIGCDVCIVGDHLTKDREVFIHRYHIFSR